MFCHLCVYTTVNVWTCLLGCWAIPLICCGYHLLQYGHQDYWLVHRCIVQCIMPHLSERNSSMLQHYSFFIAIVSFSMLLCSFTRLYVLSWNLSFKFSSRSYPRSLHSTDGGLCTILFLVQRLRFLLFERFIFFHWGDTLSPLSHFSLSAILFFTFFSICRATCLRSPNHNNLPFFAHSPFPSGPVSRTGVHVQAFRVAHYRLSLLLAR